MYQTAYIEVGTRAALKVGNISQLPSSQCQLRDRNVKCQPLNYCTIASMNLYRMHIVIMSAMHTDRGESSYGVYDLPDRAGSDRW